MDLRCFFLAPGHFPYDMTMSVNAGASPARKGAACFSYLELEAVVLCRLVALVWK